MVSPTVATASLSLDPAAYRSTAVVGSGGMPSRGEQLLGRVEQQLVRTERSGQGDRVEPDARGQVVDRGSGTSTLAW